MVSTKSEPAKVSQDPAKIAARETVDPTDYVPTPKEAPEPATPTVGDTVAPTLASEPRGARTEVIPAPRKPRHTGAVASALETAKGVADKVRKVIEPVSQPTANHSARLRDIDAKDKRHMRAVRKYGKRFREALPTMVRYALIAQGVKPETSTVNSLVATIAETKVDCGFKVVESKREGKGETMRRLPFHLAMAYLYGVPAVSVEEWSADQWIKHPIAATGILTVLAFGDVWLSAFAEGTPFAQAVASAVASVASQEPIKAEARVSDPE